MIAVSFSPAEVRAGEPTDISLRIVNTGVETCSNVVLKLDFPVQVRVRGDSRIEVNRLAAGEDVVRSIRVRVDTPGVWTVTSPNFSYRDSAGRTVRVTDFRTDITVAAAPAPAPAPAGPSLRLALATPALTLHEWEQLSGWIDNDGDVAAHDVVLRIDGPVSGSTGATLLGDLAPATRRSFTVPVSARESGSSVPIGFEIAYVDGDRAPRRVRHVRPVRVDRLRVDPQRGSATGAAPPYRILFLASNPRGGPPLRLDAELRDIRDRLTQGRARDRFELHDRTAVRTGDIARHLRELEPCFVHFSGHGTVDGDLVLESDAGRSMRVPASAVAHLFSLVADSVECVVLNACYSEVLGTAIAAHIRYVIGMRTEIGDVAASKFSNGFYSALAEGEPIDRAFEYGRTQIMLYGIPEFQTPVLRRRPD